MTPPHTHTHTQKDPQSRRLSKPSTLLPKVICICLNVQTERGACAEWGPWRSGLHSQRRRSDDRHAQTHTHTHPHTPPLEQMISITGIGPIRTRCVCVCVFVFVPCSTLRKLSTFRGLKLLILFFLSFLYLSVCVSRVCQCFLLFLVRNFYFISTSVLEVKTNAECSGVWVPGSTVLRHSNRSGEAREALLCSAC